MAAALLYTEFKPWPGDTGYVQQIDHYDGGGVVARVLPVGDPAHPLPAAAANYVALITKARAALAANQTFLAIGSPTQAQAVAQAQALTRQMDAVIFFLLHEILGLATIPGT